MFRKTLLGIIVALSWPGGTHAAACSADACSGLISLLYMSANDATDQNIYIAMVGGLGGLTVCTPVAAAQPLFTLPAGSSNLQQIFATALAAQMAGRPVTIRANAGSGCVIRYLTSP